MPINQTGQPICLAISGAKKKATTADIGQHKSPHVSLPFIILLPFHNTVREKTRTGAFLLKTLVAYIKPKCAKQTNNYFETIRSRKLLMPDAISPYF